MFIFLLRVAKKGWLCGKFGHQLLAGVIATIRGKIEQEGKLLMPFLGGGGRGRFLQTFSGSAKTPG